MRRTIIAVLAMWAAMLTGNAQAEVKLVNKDKKAHNIAIKCKSGGGTTKTSIQSNTTRSIGKGPCEVDVEGRGKMSASDGGTITIERGR